MRSHDNRGRKADLPPLLGKIRCKEKTFRIGTTHNHIMPAQFNIEKQGGQMPPKSRLDFRQAWNALPDGEYRITIEPAGKSYRPSRYKYYFDSVLFEILRQAGRHFRVTNPATGEIREVRETAELHEIMKMTYNPVTVQAGSRLFNLPGTTTELNDREFIGTYLEQIMSEHAGPPYLVDFVDYEGWKALRRAGIYKQL